MCLSLFGAIGNTFAVNWLPADFSSNAGILRRLQEVVVSTPRELLLDDLGFHPLAVVLHREPRHRGMRRQRDLERALAAARFGIVEVEMELGVREGVPRRPPWHRRASTSGPNRRSRVSVQGGTRS